MQDQSSILSLPLIQPSQAQKHVTHNEALRILDVLVQLAVIDRDRTSPPDDPAPGDRHIVGTGATGAWSGADLRIAIWEEGGWGFLDPRPGWRAEVLSEARGLVFDGTAWVVRLPELDNLPGLGLNTSADATNRLAVASPATLLTHEGAGHQLKVNKAISTDTASLLFQTGFSGRAEMGTAGNDDWSIKVSPDGITWTEALRVAAASGRVTGQAIQSSPADATEGRLMAVGAGGVLAASSPALTDLDAFDIPQGFYRVDGTTVAGTVPPVVTVADGVLVMHSTANQTTQYYTNPNDGRSYLRKSFGSHSWGGWRLVYDQKFTLGTVSQSGGVPTGALIERGSNANGIYTRFADGTQICWNTLTFTDLATATIGQQTWTYPAAFGAVPDLKTHHNGVNLAVELRSGGVAAAGNAEIVAYHEIGSASTRNVAVLATGR
ncbi:hypothetical protein RA2_04199 [Roseovarius sp. A-2]|uniref:DUF2793 domain-containing protein n=1 Tax=Roseovarius sp. A-2 TaxID=1570360 RepID=UPI0009B548B0|nr:DUF2793 domain-containing protein [Roseovarius sp. A-2]GAW37124.1 hypothetical protein RA2_04199 [Roseovarius sp. A-2]